MVVLAKELALAKCDGLINEEFYNTTYNVFVFTVNGIVGFVDAGNTFPKAAAFIMSGECPPPAPSVWNVCIVLPAIASIVSSIYPASFNVSVCIATCTSYSSATLKQVSITAGVAPQSSCILSPTAPANICSFNAPFVEQLPLPKNPKFIGYSCFRKP